jgi:hypothetical protein
MRWQEEIEVIIADAEKKGAFQSAIETPTIEDEIREFLSAFGSHWRNSEIVVHTLQRGTVVYTALLLDKLYERYYANEDVFLVVARDSEGRLYIAPPSPVE